MTRKGLFINLLLSFWSYSITVSIFMIWKFIFNKILPVLWESPSRVHVVLLQLQEDRSHFFQFAVSTRFSDVLVMDQVGTELWLEGLRLTECWEVMTIGESGLGTIWEEKFEQTYHISLPSHISQRTSFRTCILCADGTEGKVAPKSANPVACWLQHSVTCYSRWITLLSLSQFCFLHQIKDNNVSSSSSDS